MSLYEKIMNPKTGNMINITSHQGKALLNNYIKQLQGGVYPRKKKPMVVRQPPLPKLKTIFENEDFIASPIEPAFTVSRKTGVPRSIAGIMRARQLAAKEVEEASKQAEMAAAIAKQAAAKAEEAAEMAYQIRKALKNPSTRRQIRNRLHGGYRISSK